MLRNVFLVFLTTFSVVTSTAQNRIEGKVIDAVSRQPLEGASVRVGNDAAQVSTDQWGYFSVPVKSQDSLEVSFIGFKPLVIAVPFNEPVMIALERDAVSLSDVTIQAGSSNNQFSTISRVDLNLKPVRNTQELLRLVPGLFIAQHAGGGKAEQIFLRGFDLDHGTDIAISVDGMPVNMVSHAHGQGYADAHFIIPETVNKVDYGTGPYYGKQGNLNTAGYVAFATFNQIDKSRVEVDGGRFGTARALAMIDLLKKDKDRQSAYAAGEFYYTNGPTIQKQHLQRYNLFGKYQAALSPHTQITGSVSAFKSSWDASGQIPERAVESGLITRFGSIDPSEGGNTERYNASLRLARRFSQRTTWENQLYYSRYGFDLFSNFTFFLHDPVNGDGIQQREKRNIWGYTSTLHQHTMLSAWDWHATYGAGFRYDDILNSQLAHVVQRRFLADKTKGKIKEWNAFAYSDQQFSRGRWVLDAALRYDLLRFAYADELRGEQPSAQAKAIASPKVSLQYTANKKVQVYAKAGKGFHSNDTRVVVANSGKEILPAAYGADLGVALKPNSRLLLNLAAWYLYLEQEFVYVGDEGVIEPGGKTRRKGIDLLARYQLATKLFAHLNLNLTQPRAMGAPKGENYIPLAPTFTSTGGLYYKAPEGMSGSLSYRYIKPRPANEDNSIVARGYFLLDGAVNYTRPKYEVGLALENILNAAWNEAQFATETRLKDEPAAVDELHFTPGAPFFIKAKLALFF